jgi:hypothetical protein
MKRGWPAAVLLLSGCAAYNLVEPHQDEEVCELYSVESGIKWSELARGDVLLWTVDGAELESIRFISEIREGVAIMDITEQKHETPFRPDMSETELVDAIVDAFSLSGAQQVEARDLRPAPFGSEQGFRFEVGFTDENGLHKEGAVVGAIVDEALYLIIYTAAKLHYFPKYRDEFEGIVNSIRIRGSRDG